ELEVDIDGEVTMRGATPEIYLNGRPAPMDGEALNVFLDQFPADRIERIEVIPNPSARFNAEGSGGIVNIVLKEDAGIGLSGSVFANGSSRGDVGGGGRVAWQRGDWLFSGGGYLRSSDRDRSSYDLRQNLLADPTTYLRQDAASSSGGLSGSVDLTVEREVGPRGLLWTEGRLHSFGQASDGVTTTTHMDASMDTTQLYDRISGSDSDRLSFDLATGFDYTWEQRRHAFESELEFEYGSDTQDRRVETFFEELEAGADPAEAALTVEEQSEKDTELTLQFDYVRPLGERGRLEVGYRGEMEDRSDDRLLERFQDADPSGPGDALVDGFDYSQVFNSLYVTALQRFGDVGVQLGVRGERADTRFSLPNGDSYDNDYNSLFPSANISYDFGGGKQMRLSYSRRIRRPNPRVMNPIDRSTDPLNRRVGNPYIDPQYTQSLSLDASWSASLGTLRLSPYYRITTDDWAQIKTVDGDGVSTVTWENLATQERYGASVTASVRPLDGWSGFVSVSGNREVRDASNLAPTYSGSSFRWSARANLSARVTPDLSMQGMVSYSPARDVPQGRISSRTMTHFGLRQQLLDDRASVRVSVVDPFDLFNSSFETRDPTHVQVGSSSFSMRSVRISLSYAFGDPDRGRDDRDAGMENDAPMDEGIR
ncbi:MAG TPA: TonB-dependent receptor, partial [Longimicrobiales bacterium]|nr:TonB-dependent receptor [Longimicrobiales bacterium]